MFIKYEAEVSSRVGGGERGVVDFGKLFTETNELASTALQPVDHANIVYIRQSVNLPDVAECIALRTHKFKVNFRKTFSWAEVICKLLNS